MWRTVVAGSGTLRRSTACRTVDARQARGNGEEDLLCGVRQPAASRSAIAARTPRSTASYPREAARAGTIAPAQGLPQDRGETHLLCAGRGTASSRLRRTARYGGAYARVAVGGRSSGGHLPRSPAVQNSFLRPARPEKIQIKIFAVLAAKAIKRIVPGATAKDVRGNCYV